MTYCLVPKNELVDLLYDSLKLQALEVAGVDSWNWYGDSIRDFIDAAKVDYNIPKDDDDFDISDMASVDVEGYEMIER